MSPSLISPTLTLYSGILYIDNAMTMMGFTTKLYTVVAEMQKTCQELETQVELMKQDMQNQQTNHSIALEQQQDQHQSALKTLRQSNHEMLESMRKSHAQSVLSLRRQFEAPSKHQSGQLAQIRAQQTQKLQVSIVTVTVHSHRHCHTVNQSAR
jgi:DNA anti-recombination protein RmuC